MFLLILDSLGSTELLFILVMALVFFGPRKLPQISRSLGKNIAEFRKASEDFKRTWEREVALETETENSVDRVMALEDNSIANPEAQEQSLQEPMIKAVAGEHVVARETHRANTPIVSSTEPAQTATVQAPTPSEPARKQDWL